MYVGYHDADNVSNFGGDPIKFKKRFIVLFVSVRRHVAILLGAWWMADYETLHVCRVPWHNANNVSNFGGDPVTQLNFKKFYSII